MTVIQLDSIKRDKHKLTLRQISDLFDENRGQILDDVAFTKFDNNNHIVLFNTKSPELNGKTLIQYDNDKILFAPVSVKIGMCSEPEFNTSVNLLFNSDNGKKKLWEARSNAPILSFRINLKESSDIGGFSMMFDDSTKTKYRMSIILANENNEILSQVNGLESSYDSNNQQFFQFTKIVEGVSKVKLDVELVGQNKDFEWKMYNISFYSNMNMESLKNLNNLGVINWTLAQNPLLIKDLKEDQVLKEGEGEQQPMLTSSLELSEQLRSINAIELKGSNYEYDLSRQYFDNLTEKDWKSISSIKRPHSITESPKTGKKIYVFETDPKNRSLELRFQPIEEEGKYNDHPVTNLEELRKQGYIKKGGFKNYILTIYVKLNDMMLQGQYLIWRYGGWLMNPELPDHARFTDVMIPINSSDDEIKICTEYKLGLLNELHLGTENTEIEKPYIESERWVGLQFIRRVQDDVCYIDVNINKDPFDDEGNMQGQFVTLRTLEDVSTDDHIANTWGGMCEWITITGSKYVNLTGVSLYEIKE